MSGNKDQAAPIIIKKKKGGHGGGHGGAWKVAYADFVTAMMALFIVLWIVGQNQSVKAAISEYFKDPVAFNEKVKASGGTGILPDFSPPGAKGGDQPPALYVSQNQPNDLKQLEEEKKKIEEMIKNTPAFDKFKGQVEISVTNEGLRIELVDNSSGLFFDVGSARLKVETVQMLGKIAAEIGKLPNRVIVEGYTDARPYVTPNYSNWELSVDRANAARKIMSENGLQKNQVHAVRGFADQRLRRPENPMDFSNRRVSILVPPLPAPGAASPDPTGGKVKVGG
jgi:chemotaxis protein MotB